MAFFRNVQVRFMPIQGDTRLTFALERPGASGDGGLLGDRIELQNVRGRNPLPDFTWEYRYGRKWGYVELAGILGALKWDDLLENDPFDLSGSATRWGFNLTSNIKFGYEQSTTLRLAALYGEGMENYMNDAPVDVGIVRNRGNPSSPIDGKAIPITGVVAFVDHNWNKHWSSTLGYSGTFIDNTEGQNDNAYRTGHYALGNLLFTPVSGVMMGGELQWGQRHSFRDDFIGDGFKLQFGFKYNFSQKIGG